MNKPCELCIGTGVNIMHGHPCTDCGGRGCRQQDQPKPAEGAAMSPDQIEAAARELCRMNGLDADADPDYPFAPNGKPLWQTFAAEVERFAQIGTAIAHALAQPAKKPRKRKEAGCTPR